jgi:hypothetical protein
MGRGISSERHIRPRGGPAVVRDGALPVVITDVRVEGATEGPFVWKVILELVTEFACRSASILRSWSCRVINDISSVLR